MAEAAEGNYAAAEAALFRCLAIKRKLFAGDHPEVLLTEKNLAAL